MLFLQTLVSASRRSFSDFDIMESVENTPKEVDICCSSLLENVASNSSDFDVWYAVYELLEEFSRTPPDSVLKSSTFDTTEHEKLSA
jgi:hypothetical protein